MAAVIDQLNPVQRQELLRLLIEDVQVTGWQVEIRLRIPLDDPPDDDHPHRRTPHPGQLPPATARRQCQPKNVCVPFMAINGPSYRLKNRLAAVETTINSATA